MKRTKLPDLVIGDLIINPPIIQGGMGVRISKSSLASAVSNTGALGVIASVGLGDEKESEKDYLRSSAEALRTEIIKTRTRTQRPFGVNIMVTLSNYDTLVKIAVEEKVDAIISGAGLPLKLPLYTKGSSTKLIPIVSSGRAANIVCEVWKKKYNLLPDAIVVEGPLAGGHLGFNKEELNNINNFSLEKILIDVLEVIKQFERTYKAQIPVVAAGGIFDGADIARMLKLGASGVQMATRFVCTYECDAALKFKEVFLNSKKEDIIIIDSPVGLPGRVIKNKFVERILKGEKIKFRCPYRCLKSCDVASVNYCIADALVNASKGNFEDGFAMCGANAYRINKIVPVKELVNELIKEAEREFYK
ncbi:MAG: nitronate monooxygenase family protein [Candidatus Omnitrophica bacterium]|nr:nitronate monooxygenase family protein [Candidatus Omnitrophota bacterium]